MSKLHDVPEIAVSQVVKSSLREIGAGDAASVPALQALAAAYIKKALAGGPDRTKSAVERLKR